MMKISKNMIIAVTIAFCFIASIFMVIPIRSQSSGQYDPWLDINDDGRINMDEVVASTTAFGATGDPTKNVTVTNLHDYEVQTGTLNVSSNGWGSPEIFCGGYSRLSILLVSGNASVGIGNNITIYLYGITWSEYSGAYGGGCWSFDDIYDSNVFNITLFNGGGMLWIPRSYITETKAPHCALFFGVIGLSLPANWWATVGYAVYLRNE